MRCLTVAASWQGFLGTCEGTLNYYLFKNPPPPQKKTANFLPYKYKDYYYL